MTSRFLTYKGVVRSAWLGGVLLFGAGAPLAETGAAPDTPESGFGYQERSTLGTIPLHSIDEDTLANTVVEGGLAAPAAGVPVASGAEDEFYLDPLALQPRDERTDLGRTEIPVDIRFSNPKVIPGQSHSGNYLIRPPENRAYDTLNTTLRER